MRPSWRCLPGVHYDSRDIVYCGKSIALACGPCRWPSAVMGYKPNAVAGFLRSCTRHSQRGRAARARVMASDADIVRCAAPWPGTAARLLEGLAALGPGTWSVEQICRASASGTELGHAAQILAGLSTSRVFESTKAGDSWSRPFTPAELFRLSHLLPRAH